MSAQFKPASLFVSGMSHLCPCLLPCSILPFIPFSAVTFRSISYRLGSSLHVEARLRCVIPLYFDLALRSTFAERINSQTCDSRTGCLDLLSVSFYIVAALLVHSELCILTHNQQTSSMFSDICPPPQREYHLLLWRRLSSLMADSLI